MPYNYIQPERKVIQLELNRANRLIIAAYQLAMELDRPVKLLGKLYFCIDITITPEAATFVFVEKTTS